MVCQHQLWNFGNSSDLLIWGFINQSKEVVRMIVFLRMIKLSEQTGRVIRGLSRYVIEINRVTDRVEYFKKYKLLLN